MKLLKMRIDGLDLFKKGLEINFIGQQKVTESNREGLSRLVGSIYKQDVLALIGINASGKTTTLKWISMLLNLYLKGAKVNEARFEPLIKDQQIILEAYFFTGVDIIKVQSYISKNNNNELVFKEEKLWKKRILASMSRKKMFEFTDKQLAMIRSEEDSPFLSDHMSIMISEVKKYKKPLLVVDLLHDTNLNIMRVAGDIPSEIVSFLDDNVEYIKYETDKKKKNHIRLKFKRQEDDIFIYEPLELEAYLSSGTIRGLNVFAGIQNVLATGGFLIIDEIENHFNKEIVRTIIRFFKNKKINVTGATLIFTTHYAELLDDFERNDSIYITFKDETLKVINLFELLRRSDYKKSEVYQSGYVGRTAPSYNAYMSLKKYFLELGEQVKEIYGEENE